MAQVEVKFLREDWADPDLPLPRYETDGAAGFDLRAQFTADAREAGLTLAPQTRALIQTGFVWLCLAGMSCKFGRDLALP